MKLPALAAACGAILSATVLKAEAPLSLAIGLVREHDLREFRLFRHMSDQTIIVYVLVGMAILALIVYAIQRRRRRWLRL
jgi:hypothetical protein